LSGTGSWTPPANVTGVAVTELGAAGAGASLTAAGKGGAGAGAEWAYGVLPVTAGIPVPYACGIGGVPQGTSTVAPSQFATPGTIQWTCPAGVTSLTVTMVGGSGGGAFTGAGGGDGGGGNVGPGSGGGGGEWSQATITVIPGQVYTIVVGAGGMCGLYFYNYGKA